jgi:hypothetical protein
MKYPGGKGTSTKSERKGLSYRPRLNTSDLRIIGSLGFILSQYVFLFQNQKVGLSMFILSQLLVLPYFVRKGYWDVTLLGIVGLLVNVAGLVHVGKIPFCQ